MKKVVALLTMMLPGAYAHAAGSAALLTDHQLDGVTAGSSLTIGSLTIPTFTFTLPAVTVVNFYGQSASQQADILGDVSALIQSGITVVLGH
jgi:hypothetical protein